MCKMLQNIVKNVFFIFCKPYFLYIVFFLPGKISFTLDWSLEICLVFIYLFTVTAPGGQS